MNYIYISIRVKVIGHDLKSIFKMSKHVKDN
jgi:hypothetical protein